MPAFFDVPLLPEVTTTPLTPVANGNLRQEFAGGGSVEFFAQPKPQPVPLIPETQTPSPNRQFPIAAPQNSAFLPMEPLRRANGASFDSQAPTLSPKKKETEVTSFWDEQWKAGGNAALMLRQMIPQVQKLGNENATAYLSRLAEKYDGVEESNIGVGDLFSLPHDVIGALAAKTTLAMVDGETMRKADRDMAIFDQLLKERARTGNPFAVKNFFGLITETMLGQVLPMLGISLVGGPTAGLAFMGTQVFADQYHESRTRRDRSVEAAMVDATWMTIAEVATEKIPLGAALEKGVSFWKRVGKTAAFEGIQEPISELLSMAWEMGVFEDDITAPEAIQRLVLSGMAGAFIGGKMGAIVHPFIMNAESEYLLQQMDLGDGSSVNVAVGGEQFKGNIDEEILAEGNKSFLGPPTSATIMDNGPNLTMGEKAELVQLEKNLEKMQGRPESAEYIPMVEAAVNDLRSRSLSRMEVGGQLTFGEEQLGAIQEEQKEEQTKITPQPGETLFVPSSNLYAPYDANDHLDMKEVAADFTGVSYGKPIPAIHDEMEKQIEIEGLQPALNAWTKEIDGLGLEALGGIITPDSGYYKVVQRILQKHFKGKKYITVYHGHEPNRAPMHPDLNRNVGSGTVKISMALSAGIHSVTPSRIEETMVTAIRVPIEDVIAINNEHANEVELIFRTHRLEHQGTSQPLSDRTRIPLGLSSLANAEHDILHGNVGHSVKQVLEAGYHKTPIFHVESIGDTTLTDRIKGQVTLPGFGPQVEQKTPLPDIAPQQIDAYGDLDMHGTRDLTRDRDAEEKNTFADIFLREYEKNSRLHTVSKPLLPQNGRESVPTREQLNNWAKDRMAEGSKENDVAYMMQQMGQYGFDLTRESRIEKLFEYVHHLKQVISPARHPPAAGGMAGKIKKLMSMVADQEVRNRANLDLDKYDWIVKHGWTLIQLVDKNRHIPGMTEYLAMTSTWHNTKMEWISRADRRVKAWQDLHKGQADGLANFLFDLNEMVYIKRDKLGRRREKVRWPTEEEFVTLAKKYNLNSDALELYEGIKVDFHEVLNRIESVLLADAQAIFKDNPNPEAFALKETKIKKDMEELRSHPYFPLSRYGNYTIVVKLGDTVVDMRSYESEFESGQDFASVRKQYPKEKGFTLRKDKIPEEVGSLRGMPPGLIQTLKEKLKLDDINSSVLEQLEFEMSAANSFKKHLLKRDYTPGYSKDAMRNYADYFFHGANHLARIEHYRDMRDAINVVKHSIQAFRNMGYDELSMRKRIDIQTHLETHLDYIMTPQNDLPGLRALGFVWYLGFNVSSAMVNLTQVPLVAMPYLSDRFGDVEAGIALTSAYNDIRKIYSKKAGGTVDEALLSDIELIIAMGTLDESQATELAAVADSDTLVRALPGSQAQRAWRTISYASAYLFQQAERLNRRIVFRAARDLALKNPNADYLNDLKMDNANMFAHLLSTGRSPDASAAFLAGRDAVIKTQYEYASWNRPNFMRGKKSVLFLFYSYLQNTLWFARYSPGRGRFLLTMLATAGVMGLPGAEDLADFARWAGRRFFGKNFNPEDEMRKMLVELSSEHPDFWLHGASRYGFGLSQLGEMAGMPYVPSFDLSRRLSLGDIIPGTAALARPGDFDHKFLSASTDVGGAVVSGAIAMMQAIADTGNPDNFKRWERAMPAFLRGLSKATRLSDRGFEMTNRGAKLTEFDTSDWNHMAELAGISLGFNPTRLSQKWDAVRQQTESEMYFATRRESLLRALDHATYTGDKEGRKDAQDAINRYNKEVPYRALRISRKTQTTSLRERKRRRRLAERGIPAQKQYKQLARDITKLHPENKE